MQTLIFVLLFFSLFFTFLGGTIDYMDNLNKKDDNSSSNSNNKTSFFVSKEHLWNDGVYLLLLASFLQIYLNKIK